MNQETFARNLTAAQTFRDLSPTVLSADFWTAYMRGLRRKYHGNTFGTKHQHDLWRLSAHSDDPQRRARGEGYAAGILGKTTTEAIEILDNLNLD